jgi:hypothetical protein
LDQANAKVEARSLSPRTRPGLILLSMAKAPVGSAVVSVLLLASLPALSQTETPATAAYPPDPGPASGAPAAPAATPATAAPLPAAPPPPVYQAPAANPAAPSSANASRQQPAPSGDGYNVGNSGIVEPPAPPPKENKEGFTFPDMSIRVDPLNWIIYGRLGIELEATVWKFITAEMVPIFVTSHQPPFLNLGSFPGNMYQASNGLGAMSGASIGAGFWLDGKPFRGTVLRLIYTNYGYRYTSKTDSGAVLDEATHTDRYLAVLIGSHSKWGPFTIASGIGLGVEMNRERRCIDPTTSAVSSNCTKDVFEIRLPQGGVYGIYGWLHPADILFRLSLGFVF